ncbi:glycoside hydrolase family 25 protein [Nocardioides sp. LML1-1-1.1]|uniref:glycoside hydrolase family 25 protein n=1 Tax=Nocardioides sp. LML1-1-1.1 TaxID=3135248 RepID=UPI003420229B
MRIPAVLAALTLALSACGGGTTDTRPTPAPTPTPTTATPTTATPTTATPTTASPTPVPTRDPAPSYRDGIDASHHQGPIAWREVARSGITFAYLKASEGTGFTDPDFADNRRKATRAGIDVAGYHYFQLCSDGAAQAEHFLAVLGDARSSIPPALDLELQGSCADPPAPAALLTEVRAFLRRVDRATGMRTLVYLYPELEARYGFADDLASHPQWVRRLGDRPPRRPWAVWQHDDAGSVPGMSGNVDLNRMRADRSD